MFLNCEKNMKDLCFLFEGIVIGNAYCFDRELSLKEKQKKETIGTAPGTRWQYK